MQATEHSQRSPALDHSHSEIMLAHALLCFRSRAQWKALPFDMLPPYYGCTLAFQPFHEDDVAVWVEVWKGKERELSSCIEISALIDDQFKYRRSHDGLTRAKTAARIRRRWCALVDHAIGYRVAGIDHAVFAFGE